MTIIKDNQEKLAELLATFTPEEMEQYKLAVGFLDDITKEMAYEEMKKLGVTEFHMTGVDLNEKGEFAKLLTHIEALKKQEESKGDILYHPTDPVETMRSVGGVKDNHYGLEKREEPISTDFKPFTKLTDAGLPEGFGKFIPEGERENIRIIEHPLNETKEKNNE